MRKFLLGAPSVVTGRGAEVEKRAESAAEVAREVTRVVAVKWERASVDIARVGGIVRAVMGR